MKHNTVDDQPESIHAATPQSIAAAREAQARERAESGLDLDADGCVLLPRAEEGATSCRQ